MSANDTPRGISVKIAVLEDDDTLRELVTSMLDGRGYGVVAFSSLAEARAALADDPPHLLISDVELPDGCGLDLVASLRDHQGQRVPAIVLSGLREEGDFVRGFTAGAVDYIGKPFSRDELLARCAMQLARATANAAGAQAKSDDKLPVRDGLAFGRYAVEKELGRGGYGRVFLARDMARGGACIALKVLDPQGGDQDEAKRRFIRETYTASTVHHPRVATLHDSGTMDGRFYYAMEFVPGISLQAHIRQNGPLSEDDATALARGLLEALAAVGNASLLHRDLKPENVILRQGKIADPVLIDFGLAKRPLDRGLTDANVIVGTVGYLSPETIRGDALDARSDLFSLGLTLRFALLGEEVFPELSGIDVLSAIAKGPIPPAGIALSSAFDGFLGALLEIQPERRPRNAVTAARLLDKTEAADRTSFTPVRRPV